MNIRQSISEVEYKQIRDLARKLLPQIKEACIGTDVDPHIVAVQLVTDVIYDEAEKDDRIDIVSYVNYSHGTLNTLADPSVRHRDTTIQ